MKRLLLFLPAILLIVIFNSSKSVAQSVGINADGSAPNPSAMLDVKSSTKGVLLPRMSTTQRSAISNPVAGLLVYDSTEQALYMYDGHSWLGFSALTPGQRPANNFTFGPDGDTLLTGYSVSMWDQFAAVGAPYKKAGSVLGNGAVYIYKNNGSTWQLFTTLTPPGTADTAVFGNSVCLRGNYLIVGAYYQKDLSNKRVGAAHIYNFNGSSWSLVQTIYGTVAGSQFGQCVAINQFGTYAAVGEPYATVSGLANAGKINIYYKPASTYTFQTAINDASPAASENFGQIFAMSSGGFHIIVGTPNKTVGGHYGNGYVGQFDRSGTATWTQTHTYTPVSEDNLNIGTFVDITEAHAMWITGKYKQASLVDMGWSGYGAPPISGVTNINGISLDPTTENPYIFADNAVYSGYYGAMSKIKSFNTDFTQFNGLPGLLSVYNKNYVLGFPFGPSQDKQLQGAAYFGVSPY